MEITPEKIAKLKELKAKMLETQNHLSTLSVKMETNSDIKVVVNGLKQIVFLEIPRNISGNLSTEIMTLVNRAMGEVEVKVQLHMAKTMQSIVPDQVASAF